VTIQSASTTRATNKVVVVVDDDDDHRELLVQCLGREYRVLQAVDGEDAFDLLRRIERPDAMILDVMMPKVDGLYLARCMKSDPGLRTVPIIFLTGLSDPRDIISGIQAGARSYLVKPFRTDELLEKVRKAVRSSVTTP
jgi:DNA-binding response OmpR family regulator